MVCERLIALARASCTLLFKLTESTPPQAHPPQAQHKLLRPLSSSLRSQPPRSLERLLLLLRRLLPLLAHDQGRLQQRNRLLLDLLPLKKSLDAELKVSRKSRVGRAFFDAGEEVCRFA